MSRARNNLFLAVPAALLAAMVGLVVAGALNGVDQWACDHLTPFAGSPGGPPTFLESLVPLFHSAWHPAGVAVAQVVTLPGQVILSFLLVGVGAWKLRAPGWMLAWLSATVVEVVFRRLVTRPALYRDGVHLTGFDASWPSGHALHCTLVAAVFAAAWPRLRVPLAAWLVAALALIELVSFHTVTDVAGGVLLALLAAGALRKRGDLLL